MYQKYEHEHHSIIELEKCLANAIECFITEKPD